MTSDVPLSAGLIIMWGLLVSWCNSVSWSWVMLGGGDSKRKRVLKYRMSLWSVLVTMGWKWLSGGVQVEGWVKRVPEVESLWKKRANLTERWKLWIAYCRWLRWWRREGVCGVRVGINWSPLFKSVASAGERVKCSVRLIISEGADCGGSLCVTVSLNAFGNCSKYELMWSGSSVSCLFRFWIMTHLFFQYAVYACKCAGWWMINLIVLHI